MKIISKLFVNFIITYFLLILLENLGVDLSFQIRLSYIQISILLTAGTILLILIYKNIKHLNKTNLSKIITIFLYLYNQFTIKFAEENFFKSIHNSKSASFFNKLLTKYRIIPISILLFGIFTSIFITFYQDTAKTLITRTGEKGYFHIYSNKPIEHAIPITGEFTAIENNLGIISIRFDNYQSARELLLMFKIKEKGKENWLTENEYLGSQFHNSGYMFFGLPIQPNSKTQKYYFELSIAPQAIYSQNQPDQFGNTSTSSAIAVNTVASNNFTFNEDPLVLSNTDSVIRTHYKLTKETIATDWNTTFRFLILKIQEFLITPTFYLGIILTFLLFFMYQISIKKIGDLFTEITTYSDLTSVFIIIYLIYLIYSLFLYWGKWLS